MSVETCHSDWSMNTSLSEQAYMAIREKILRGELALGEPLSRRAIAGQMGMSLLPVTEALQRLEAEGLVESRPRVGTRVKIPSRRDIRDTFIVREALEVQSARLFAEHASAARRRELVRKAERVDVLFNRLANSETDAEFQYLVHSDHCQFHLFIAESTECELLFHMIERNQILILNWLYDVAAGRRALPRRFHRNLAELLVSGDVSAADRGMREHVHYGLEDTLSGMLKQTTGDWRRPRTAGSGLAMR